MSGKELASLLPDWFYFIRDSVHESTSGLCACAAQHNTVGRPFTYYEIVGHRVNQNNIILTNWIIRGTPALGCPNLLIPRVQWNAEPGSCILTLLLFGFLSPCHDLPFPMLWPPHAPLSLALPPPQVHTFQIVSTPQEVQCTFCQTPVMQFQNPSSHLPCSETSHPHLNLRIPTGHDSCAVSSAWMCIHKHRRPLESGLATSSDSWNRCVESQLEQIRCRFVRWKSIHIPPGLSHIAPVSGHLPCFFLLWYDRQNKMTAINPWQFKKVVKVLECIQRELVKGPEGTSYEDFELV